MSIKDVMKKHAANLGFSTESKSTTELYDDITHISVVDYNPLAALVVDTEIGPDFDLLGKVVGDFQKNINVYKDCIDGSLYYVDNYTGFSGDKSEQSGHYLVLHAAVDYEDCDYSDGVRITVTNYRGTVELDSDGILIYHFKDDDKNQVITFTAKKLGLDDVSISFDLSRLTLLKDKAPTT